MNTSPVNSSQPSYVPPPTNSDPLRPIVIPNVVYVSSPSTQDTTPPSWSEWSQANINAGVTHAFQSLVSALVIDVIKGLLTAAILAALPKQAPQPEPLSTEEENLDQKLKIALFTGDCSELVTEGKVNETVLNMLRRNQADPNYKLYIPLVAKCLQKKDTPPAPQI